MLVLQESFTRSLCVKCKEDEMIKGLIYTFLVVVGLITIVLGIIYWPLICMAINRLKDGQLEDRVSTV